MNLNVCVLLQTSWGCVVLLHGLITTLSFHGECSCGRMVLPQGARDDHSSTCCSAIPQSNAQRECCRLLPQPPTKTATVLNVGVCLWPWVTCILIIVQAWSKSFEGGLIIMSKQMSLFFYFNLKNHSYIFVVLVVFAFLINRNSKKPFFNPNSWLAWNLSLKTNRITFVLSLMPAGFLLLIVVLLLLQNLLDFLWRLLIRVANTNDQITQPQLGAHCRKQKGTFVAKCVKRNLKKGRRCIFCRFSKYTQKHSTLHPANKWYAT